MKSLRTVKGQRIKTAVVGVGYLGNFHAQKYAHSEQSELVAVVDSDSVRSGEIARKLKTKSLVDYRELPGLGVEAVSVVSTTASHHEISAYLLDRGIDVLVEKPMTVTVSQARDLIGRAAAHGRILQVGHLERFNPAYRAMQDVLTRPLFFEARRISPFPARGTDVDVVLDLMIHDIDIIAHLVGRPLRHVEATGVPVLTKTPDIANARLTFEGGAVANVTASRVALKAERSLRIFQPDVYISLDYGNKKLKIYQRGVKTGFSLSSLIAGVNITERKVEERDALADEIESFLGAVQNRTAPLVTGDDGLRAIELAEKIQNAIQLSLADFADIPELRQERLANY